jgi:hypothetical protein
LDEYPTPLENSPAVSADIRFRASEYERFMFDNFKIIDKAKNPVAFAANPAQMSLNRYMELYYSILVLKARKMGFSSDALGIAATKFLMGENEKCISMSFDQTAADKQLARAKYYIQSYEEINGVKVPLKYNSRNQMVWEGKKPNGRGGYDHYQNVLQVGSARNTAFGRGDDISFLHLTEVSLADLYELMAGVGEACLPTAHKLLETTAAGFNTYKTYWDESMRNETGFACLFYSPLWEYSQEFIDAKYATLGRLGPQEYPMTSQDAFLTSGDTYFDTLAMRDYMIRVREFQTV